MTTPEVAVRLAADQLDEAGRVLARAFLDDPLMEYFDPDESRRRRWSPWWFAVACRTGFVSGAVYTTPGVVAGVAVWLSSAQTGTHLSRLLRSRAILTPLKIGIGPFGRLMTTMSMLEKLHKQAVPPAHQYLAVVGVEPARQGQGVGSALMQPILTSADADHLPCYLETQKERNIRLYQRHGFQIVEELDLPQHGPHIWTMRRAAR